LAFTIHLLSQGFPTAEYLQFITLAKRQLGRAAGYRGCNLVACVAPALGWLAKRHWGLALIPYAVMVYHLLAATSDLPAYYILYPLTIWGIGVIGYWGVMRKSIQPDA
jgi:hypothetical protein